MLRVKCLVILKANPEILKHCEIKMWMWLRLEKRVI